MAMIRVLAMNRNKGFTLLEVIIALAIVALTLGAAVRASGVVTESSGQLRVRTLALWVAQNRLEEHRAFATWPAEGEISGESFQGGMKLFWREKVTATPNELFRRIEIKIFDNENTDHVVASLTGYVNKRIKNAEPKN